MKITPRIQAAIDLARARHKTEYTDDHLIPVAEIVSDYLEVAPSQTLNTEDLIIAAILHDTVEDTDLTVADIRSQFGWTVADIVFAVTDAPAKNRKWRKALTYWKIRNQAGAELIKLADRLHNVTRSKPNEGKYFAMYQEEHPGFVGALWTPYTKYQDLWNKIHQVLFGNTMFDDIGTIRFGKKDLLNPLHTI